MDGYQMFEENPRNLWFILLLAVVLSILSLCSCASIKRQRSSEIKREGNIGINVVTAESGVKQFIEYYRAKEKSNTSAHAVIYDTSLPVNPDTGKPPIYAEINLDSSQETTKETRIEQQDSTTIKTQDKSIYKVSEDATHQDNKTRYNTNHILGFFFIIILFLFYRLIRK